MTTALGTGLRRATARLAPDPAPDGELLARFLATRDEAAFAVLVRRHAGMVFGTCRRVLGNAADADDAFQAAFVVLVRKAHSLTDRACVGNFLYGVAFHTALKARAMATKRRAKEAQTSRERERPELDELTRVLDEELAKLPDKYREPVVLCELDGVSRKEAASRLGIPEGTISSRLATAHRMLAKRMTARGFASVAVAAVLENQAFAVSDALADAAVRAAAGESSGAVTQLASEVSKMLLFNKLKAGAAVLAGVLLACGVSFGVMAKAFAADDKPAVKAPAPKKQDAKKDDELLQGLWEAETAQVRGKQVPAGDVYKVMRWKFDGPTLSITTADGEGSMKYELGVTVSPKTLALFEAGAKKASAPHAIYDLDGDTLNVCHNTLEGDAGALPTSFRAGPKDKDELIVFKRVKEKKEPAKRPDDAKLLQGTWVTKAVSFDPPMPVPPGARQEHAYHTLTFTDGDLTWASYIPGDPKTRSAQTKPFKLDQTASPKELTSGDNNCVYELDGDTLRVAMYALAAGRPKGFNAKDSPPPKAGMVWLIELTREKDDKADEPKKEANDEKLILGKWIQTSLTVEPNKNSLAPLPRQTLKFDGKGLHTDATDESGERLTNDCQYELNPNTTPKELTLSGKDSKSHWIYELDGDKLKLAGLGDGTRPTSFDPKDIPKGRTMKLVEFAREKDEPKKPEADKSYTLKDGEVLKLIPAPFADERDEVYKLAGNDPPYRTADDCLMAVTVSDGKPVSAHAFTDRKSPGADAPGKPLTRFVRNALNTDMAKVADPLWLLETTVLDADVVLKKGADPAELVAALSKELKAKCGVMVMLKFEEVEREVVVVSGKHTLKADPPADPTRPHDTAPILHLYATDQQAVTNSLLGDTRDFPSELARFVGRPVIDESDLGTNAVQVTMTFHDQYPATDKTRAEDRDPHKVLQNLATQTGLTFKLEKRTVKVLVLSKAGK